MNIISEERQILEDKTFRNTTQFMIINLALRYLVYCPYNRDECGDWLTLNIDVKRECQCGEKKIPNYNYTHHRKDLYFFYLK